MLEWFRAKGLEAYSISCGQSLLYNNIFPKHKVSERLALLFWFNWWRLHYIFPEHTVMRGQPALLSRWHCWGLRRMVSRRQAAAGGQQTLPDRLDGKTPWLSSSQLLQPLPSYYSLFHSPLSTRYSSLACSSLSCCYSSHHSVHCVLAVFPLPRSGWTRR